MRLKDGFILQNGKYRTIRVLGQGGFGITYLAENTFTDNLVAIKEFFPKDFCGRDNTSQLTLGTQNNEETVAKLKNRFLKEAQNIAKLDHPGIIKIHDIFKDNNTVYYVMDYIDGANLNEIVKRYGALSESKAIEYICKVGDALHYIHSQNMTHFDVKPANIVVRNNDDQPILIDFGLSKQYDTYGEATSTLMQGVSHGYSPIELYNAGDISSFSPQTDMYSLGATLYFLIVGSVPPVASSILNNPSILHDPILNNSQNIKEAIYLAMNPIASLRISSVQSFFNVLHSTKDNYGNGLSPENTILIQNKTHIVNGHEAVDLGLSVFWAKTDIGAFEESAPGELFVWSDNDGTKTLKVRSSWIRRWFQDAPQIINISGNTQYDSASKIWGGGWRMPTINEVKELFDKTNWHREGNQLMLTGSNGNSILIDSRKHWTAESRNGKSIAYEWMVIQNQLRLDISHSKKDWAHSYFPIRPVLDINH